MTKHFELQIQMANSQEPRVTAAAAVVAVEVANSEDGSAHTIFATNSSKFIYNQKYYFLKKKNYKCT